MSTRSLESDRGVQHVSIRYTERLTDAGVVRWVGSVDYCYGNALAATINGHSKAQVIRRRRPEPIGSIPPDEAEMRYHEQMNELAMLASRRRSGLRARTRSRHHAELPIRNRLGVTADSGCREIDRQPAAACEIPRHAIFGCVAGRWGGPRQMVQQGGAPDGLINSSDVDGIGMTSTMTAYARETNEGQFP
ncbi:MAG: hypothetical protein B7X01_02000 [Acidiphilium sp. 21-62-4]|nr:MAG: hypothetical protein B7X01_02000 [Acidiphilium sp. 21-62-4]